MISTLHMKDDMFSASFSVTPFLNYFHLIKQKSYQKKNIQYKPFDL
jgi:hypothetical protein